MPIVQSESERISNLHKKAENLLKSKLPENEVMRQLTNEGIDESYAQMIIENIGNDIQDRRNFWKQIFGGLFVTIGGLLINYFSYQIADNFSSHFFYVFWGIVAVGIIMIFRAFILFRK